MFINNYDKFIKEQKEYFENNLYKSSDKSWDDNFWLKTGAGSSWLRSRGKTSIAFGSTNQLKGIPDITIPQEYQNFCKAVLIYSYRNSNGKASPQKLNAELIVLKRWFYSLQQLTSFTHPTKIITDVLYHSYSILKSNSNAMNLPDHVGTFKRLQDIINKNKLTLKKLEFDIDIKYISRQNRTSKASKTKDLLSDKDIDESQIDSEKLISIQTFINIASLKSLCQNDGEKLLLNFLFLSIVTGFRSTEIIFLKKDCLIEKPILDLNANKSLMLNGEPQYMLGIHYYGAKGAGERIHWVEPSSAKLVKSIIQNTLELTQSYRNHLVYLRKKKLKDFLPQSIDETPEDLIELDDLIDHLFISKKRKRGRAGQRDAILKVFKNAGVEPDKVVPNGQGELKFYNKITLNQFIKSTGSYNANDPINKIFEFEGKIVNIAYEDILFIIQNGSSTLSRNLINKTTITPIDLHVLNNFLGSGKNKSVFEKYELKDNDTEFSRISSHIPRHNINTFLAIAEVSEHLQAMLMGRVDIEQNKHYQHLNIKQISREASLTKKALTNQVVNGLVKVPSTIKVTENISKSPIDDILEYGLLLFDNGKDLEANLKNNLHTFDNRNDISDFIEQSLEDNYFEDIAQKFKEIAPVDPEKARETIEIHAYLHPLPFGSCMRNVSIHGCPKRLACQSGSSCINFTVTGRLGELENLIAVKKSFTEQIENLNEDSEFTLKLNEQINNLSYFEEKIISGYSNKTPVNIYHTIDNELSQPKNLAELFSLEYEKIKNSDQSKVNEER